jgi:hypothetical protein
MKHADNWEEFWREISLSLVYITRLVKYARTNCIIHTASNVINLWLSCVYSEFKLVILYATLVRIPHHKLMRCAVFAVTLARCYPTMPCEWIMLAQE